MRRGSETREACITGCALAGGFVVWLAALFGDLPTVKNRLGHHRVHGPNHWSPYPAEPSSSPAQKPPAGACGAPNPQGLKHRPGQTQACILRIVLKLRFERGGQFQTGGPIRDTDFALSHKVDVTLTQKNCPSFPTFFQIKAPTPPTLLRRRAV